jgi:hypothetical protein
MFSTLVSQRLVFFRQFADRSGELGKGKGEGESDRKCRLLG